MFSVVKSGQVYQPTLSGNGKVVAWRDLPRPGKSEIGIQREGQDATYLTETEQAVAHPKLNQDGTVAVWEQYVGERTGSWDIARQVEGQEPEIIFTGPGLETDAEISDDGKKVVMGRWSADYRTRTADLWSEGQGETQISPDGVASGLPVIAGNGERIFYLRLPSRPDIPNEIWMKFPDGTEKPLIYETGDQTQAVRPIVLEQTELLHTGALQDNGERLLTNHKHAFASADDGNTIAWVQKDGTAPAQVWRWDFENGIRTKVGEAPLVGGLDISGDGSTVVWSGQDVQNGQRVSQIHWHNGEEERILADDTYGLNTTPTLSDDGKTIAWMWKHPKYLHPNEIRKEVLS